MLHHPPVAPHGALLSVAVLDLPPSVAFQHRPLADDWWIVVVRSGITYGELVCAYARRLPGWARWRLYTTLGVVDPAEDLLGYYRTRWWGDDWVITPATGEMVGAAGEAVGLLVPLPRASGLPEQIAS